MSNKIVWGCLFAFAVFLLVYLFSNTATNLWDFRVYHTAARTFLNGSDPYVLDQLKATEPSMLDLPYMYPPLILYFFAPFTYLELDTASILYTSLKLIALILLIKQWRLIYFPTNHALLFALFCLLGFNAAIFKDLFTGNVSIFEQLVLWIGLVHWLNQRNWQFAFCILLMSSIKLLPVVLLGLLLFSKHPNRIKVLMVSILTFLVYLGMNWLVLPELTLSYLNKFGGNAIPEGGIGNACTLEFWRSVLHYLNLEQPSVVLLISYLTTCALVVFFGYQKINQLKRRDDRQSKVELLFVFLLSFALVMPRLKDYSYILFIPPVFYFFVQNLSKLKWLLLGFVLCVSVKNVTLPIVRETVDLIWSYYTLLLVFIAWILAIQSPSKQIDQPTNITQRV